MINYIKTNVLRYTNQILFLFLGLFIILTGWLIHTSNCSISLSCINSNSYILKVESFSYRSATKSTAHNAVSLPQQTALWSSGAQNAPSSGVADSLTVPIPPTEHISWTHLLGCPSGGTVKLSASIRALSITFSDHFGW